MQIIRIMFFKLYYSCYLDYINYVTIDWLKSIGSRVVYELDHRKPVLYVIPLNKSWENCL